MELVDDDTEEGDGSSEKNLNRKMGSKCEQIYLKTLITKAKGSKSVYSTHLNTNPPA